VPTLTALAPPSPLRLGVLGPVVMTWRGDDVDLGTPQQRALWSVLLLRAGQVTTTEQLIDALWGEDGPPGARTTVRTYVSRLRRTLAARGLDDLVRLDSRAGGYVLSVPPGALDADLFRRDLAAARADLGAGRAARAGDRWRAALAHWSGRALGGVEGPSLTVERNHLELLRLDAAEDLWSLQVDEGDGAGVVAELVTAVAEEPLRERRRELLVLALYRAGRLGEALAAYRDTRERLDRELGVAPGPALRELHRRILQGDPALLVPAQDRPRPSAEVRPPVPAQLPSPARPFVGRGELLDRLAEALSGVDGVAVEGLTGLASTGTSALAVQVAHRVREEFPDGQLYADLRDVADPADAHQVLGVFLRALGTPAHAVPDATAERVTSWRTATSGRRLLVLLDHVAAAAQVRDLLPAGAGSAVLFTSARRLPALSPAHWTTVGALSPAESLELVGALAGHERVLAEREVTEQVVAACSHLPLAVRVAAARLLDRPTWSVARMAAQLDADLREPVVMAADCAIVDAPLRRTQDSLGDRLSQAFCLLAVPDCGSLDEAAAAAVLEISSTRARGVLEELVDAHVLLAAADGSYRFPGLVKAFARRQAWAEQGHERCREALQRLVDHLAQARPRGWPVGRPAAVRAELPVGVLQDLLAAS
jgi:DNA-binding SARP family transcriptional activator